MAPDFKSYLATQIIAEKQTVSYRNVSRALKVHVNSAKCMLFEFWETENKKKNGSVYATYLIAGTKQDAPKASVANGHTKHADEDVPMPSSPPPFTSSMIEPSQQTEQIPERERVRIKSVTLAREEDVESIKAQYDDITSLHIYSLSPGRLQDLLVLTDIGRGLYADTFLKEDPLVASKEYGVIQNPGVRRRKGKRQIIPDAPAPKPMATTNGKVSKQDTSKPETSSTTTKAQPKENSRPGSRDSSTSATSTKQPTLKRDGSSLFKAFAKAQTKPKLSRDNTDASTNATASGPEDTKMIDADEEGESEDDAVFLDTGTKKTGSRKRGSDIKKEREDKKAKLRKMMDSDDEAEKAVPNVEDAAGIKGEPPAAKKGGDQAETANDEDDDVAWSDSDTEKQRQRAPAKDPSSQKEEEQISTEPKRRRGKRKVMKKRTMKDEDDYLVTKEEAVWESFSEDEPEPPKEKDKPKSAFSGMKGQPASSSQKSSAGAKAGTQKKKGDIMSFFGKK